MLTKKDIQVVVNAYNGRYAVSIRIKGLNQSVTIFNTIELLEAATNELVNKAVMSYQLALNAQAKLNDSLELALEPKTTINFR